jgi:tellurite resistance protein TerC
MSTQLLFPFTEYWWLYLSFSGLVLILLAVDLGVFHRKPTAPKMKESLIWSGVWFSLALCFNAGLYLYARHFFPLDPRLAAIPGFDALLAAKQVSLEFLTGFIIEKSLAIDNIFVFVVVFAYFGIPAAYQHRVLFFGIIGALVLRAMFIALGSSLLQYEWIILVSGVFLVITGIKILLSPDKMPDPGNNPLLKLVKRLVPITSKLHGQKFFVKVGNVRHATPLFLALVFVEFSDIVFAIDSVPAIFAVTKEPLIVFTSNVFAILGLRSLYFLLAKVVDQFSFLKYGLGLILVFVGLKMSWLNEAFGGKFPVAWSLGIIATILVGSIVISLLVAPKKVGTFGNVGTRELDAKP